MPTKSKGPRPSPKAAPSKAPSKARSTPSKSSKQQRAKTPAAAGSKLDQIQSALLMHDGATMEALMSITGWQAHSVRGALGRCAQGQTQTHYRLRGARWRSLLSHRSSAMIAAATQAALLRNVTDVIIELAEDLHDRSVDADALTTRETAEAISGLGGMMPYSPKQRQPSPSFQGRAMAVAASESIR